MNTSETYRQPVLEALCAFVRDSTKSDNGAGPPTADIQAALTVIGRRKVVDLAHGPDLAYAHVPKANLGGAKLIGAHLDHANLESAGLRGAKLTDAGLRDANLNNAELGGADLRGTNLDRADLLGATNITQAQLDQACGTNVKLDPGLTIKPC